MTDEDDEFARIERENAMKGQPYHFTKRKDEDDDIQEYVRPWVGLTEDEIKQMGLSNYIKVVRETEAKLKEKNT